MRLTPGGIAPPHGEEAGGRLEPWKLRGTSLLGRPSNPWLHDEVAEPRQLMVRQAHHEVDAAGPELLHSW